MTIDTKLLEDKIGELLDIFYSKRTVALDDLKLINTLKRKNPYLYKAVGVADASEIVEEILRAHVSSSDETLFGNEFFEPLAKWVAQQAFPVATHTVNTSDGEGVDITITTSRSVMPIAVKSGVNVFNADSKKKQGENFAALNKRLLKLALHFDPVVGYCYGRKQQSARSKVNFKELAGQAFWELITNESDFYLRIVQMMGEKPINHRPEFQESFDRAKNRFAKEFLIDFSGDDGAINWAKLLEFNSGAARPKSPKPKKSQKSQASLPI
ncbi:PmeII family type II restriction endonuclease [Undibacterium sp. Tian12W]|uniref:PmeII family type II restriction endonuclease n=1 Tax=Undibacterium sp. Tian12W TaxID=3413054 RepID=UPI003BF35FA9